ncbi:MAG TPA: radical SAM peptide maturase, CXXX-repeat target family [Clostridiales bacterium]|nr:radical SAM peptide maturase, CXXX-repeat target family [Clostridiales bacterium]
MNYSILFKDTKRKEYKVGKFIPAWKDSNAQSITFIITEDCNLRCKYCYITHKSSNKKMSLETAKKFINYIFAGNISTNEAVIIEFIGGEPFIEIELIDQISDYFKIVAFEKDHDWYWNYRINICTNGVNYSDEHIQNFINKNMGKLSVSITLDGTKEKHDMHRVFPNGSGSYELIKKNIPLWISQFGGSTKVTFASSDLKFIKESIISLWNNGITNIASNVVFENVWQEGDDLLFEKQLVELADYVLHNKLYDKYYCTFFDENIGGYYNSDDLNKTYCGAGKMIALGSNGNIYPCLRYKDYSLNNKKEWVIGTVDDGIDMEKVRPFITAMIKLQSDEECINCEVASGCGFCQGFNYDEANTPTNFSRAKYICKMHKARVRANDYYFSKLFNLYGIERDALKRDHKSLYFLLSDDYITYCQHKNTSVTANTMNYHDIIIGLKYARSNFFSPIFVHSSNEFNFANIKEYEQYRILHIVPAKFHKEASQLRDCLYVFEEDDLNLSIRGISKCMLNIDSKEIENLSYYVLKLLNIVKRINVNVLNLDENFNEAEYRKQLITIKNRLVEFFMTTGLKQEINLITDLCYINERNNCKAGERSFSYAPDGRLYVCSAYYSSREDSHIANIGEEINRFKNEHLYKTSYNALCSLCDAYQCINCIYLNESATNEVNVSPSYQCRKSYIEREISRQYQVETNWNIEDIISSIKYKDPMSIYIDNVGALTGYYKY